MCLFSDPRYRESFKGVRCAEPGIRLRLKEEKVQRTMGTVHSNFGHELDLKAGSRPDSGWWLVAGG